MPPGAEYRLLHRERVPELNRLDLPASFQGFSTRGQRGLRDNQIQEREEWEVLARAQAVKYPAEVLRLFPHQNCQCLEEVLIPPAV
jgi:hypothetical protein